MTTRLPRGRRGTAATVVALVAVLVCVAGAIEAISLAANRRGVVLSASRVAKFGRQTHLDDTVVLVVAIVAVALGVLMILAALIPPRRRLVELAESDSTVAVGMTRRSLRRSLAAAATGVDGVTRSRIKGGRRYTVLATTPLRDVEPLPELVDTAVNARLTEIGPLKPPAIRVRLDRKDG